MEKVWLIFEVTKPAEKTGSDHLEYAEQLAKESSENGGVWVVYSTEVDDVYCIAYKGELYYK